MGTTDRGGTQPGGDKGNGDPARRFSRRALLQGGLAIGAAGAAAGLSSPAGASIERALSMEAGSKHPTLRDIRHVVILMQENRSFDHYYGTLSGVRGFSDPHPARLPNGRPVFYQPDPSNPDGFLLPYRLDTLTTAAAAVPSLSHDWGPQHSALDGGKMDNWVPAHIAADGAANGPYTMGYYTRQDIPFQYALADAFTIFDNYFCSVIGPTGPNRDMWMSGTIDPNGLAGGPSLTTSGPDAEFTWTTYPERLEAAGVSWKVYHEADTATGLPTLQHFTQYFDAQPGNPLYDKAMADSPVGSFEYDVANDQLPTVSWLLPPAGFDEHPANSPAAGATYVAAKIDAIAANPEVWAKTAFILNYDENDGLFDHVAPPVPPAGTPHEFVRGLPIGAGFRVPCIIVSPWTAGGWVCSQRFDHTSVLQFLEKLTGVKEPNITEWRRSTFGDLVSAFRFGDSKAGPPQLPDAINPYSRAKYEAGNLPEPTLPGAEQKPPTQEKGSRKRVPAARV